MKTVRLLIVSILFLYVSALFSFFVIDDFEDGDEFNNFHGVWYTMSDQDEDKSQVYDFNGDGIKEGSLVIPGPNDAALPVYGGASGSSYCFSIYMDITVSEFRDAGLYQNPYVAIGTSLGENPDGSNKVRDLSSYYGIGFYVKSDTVSNFRLQIEDNKGGVWTETYSYDCRMNNKNDWQMILVPFGQMQKIDVSSNGKWKSEGVTGFGFAGENQLNLDSILGFTFFFSDKKIRGHFSVDNVYLLTSSEFNTGVLPIDSDHNGIYDALDILKLLDIHYTDTSSDSFDLVFDFNRSEIKGTLDIQITDLYGGIVKHQSFEINENSAAFSETVRKFNDNGTKFQSGLYILKVTFSDHFGNVTVKKLGLALN